MQDFWFYIQLGLAHVLDLNAYDHILFLTALAIPFIFKNWKQILILATIFTVAHCTSLAFSVYGLFSVDVALIEFLIPVTITLTAIFNFSRVFKKKQVANVYFQSLATTFFGLIHGFGFSNYFNMLMTEEENKILPLLGFATGIEVSQIIIILVVLVLAFILQSVFKVKQSIFVGVTSILIFIITIPMLIETFPK